jgi:hypothetical protein
LEGVQEWYFYCSLSLLHSKGFGEKKTSRELFIQRSLPSLEENMGSKGTQRGKKIFCGGLAMKYSLLGKICSAGKLLKTLYVLFVE